VALFLGERGYRAAALRGGFGGWRDAGLPLVPVAGGAAAGPGP
jgi:rhodanese-related sulfurtransferase